ncbi:MAG: MBOAT family protein [Bacteroidetes bacterium]|nr:MBOAT family protein [Bacteroidota bacterium]
MLFNSLHFVWFFLIVTSLFFILPHKFRWLLLLLSSCFFYMDFVPIYILVLAFTIVIDYFAGILIEKSTGARRKWYLRMSIVANIGILGFFKYFNFINDNITWFLHLFKFTNPVHDLSFILPIGLSFHTFQAMSYTIEVYRGHQKSERKFGIYALYVMFYPQLVAGPIERPQNILHQFYEVKKFDYTRVVAGLKIILWGFFKKLVIADRLSIYVNAVYNNPEHHSGITFFVATFFFWFQIYCDFSGYSDIAIGSAKVMGYDLMENFRRPMFGGSIQGIWNRWHLSLYSWFRDYLYQPLAKKARRNRAKLYLIVVFIFLVSGLWHGANWTYIIWGGLSGLTIVIERIYKDKVRPQKYISKLWMKILGTIIAFTVTGISCLWFRANSVHDALHIGKSILTMKHGALFRGSPPINFYYYLIVAFILVAVEFFMEYFPNLKLIGNKSVVIRYTGYVIAVLVILLIGIFNGSQFIYFQF